MKVRDVEIYRFDLPLQQPFRISIGTMTAAADVLVRVETDSGLAGWGEACPFFPITGETQETSLAAARSLRELLIGQDPFAVGAFLRRAGPSLHANPSVLAAFDIALHDLQGKATGLPLFRLLGGENRTIRSDITADLDSRRTWRRGCGASSSRDTRPSR